jgi:ATP-dependent Lhr-like helicase
MENAGRWSPVDRAEVNVSERVERIARALLARYGVVCRRLLDRESRVPPWRDLLRVYRRLEARGEIRGGRFVDGFTGEQFALSEAVGRLRSVRRETPSGEEISISAADPLNMTGILTPGRRVPAVASNRILYRDGIPIAVHEAGDVRYLVEMGTAEQWEMRRTLMLRRVPPQLRAYLGRSA